MAEIMTVRGPIAPSELGFTSMHEHILCDASVFLRRHGALIPPNAPVAADDLIALDNLGILRHAFILSRDTMDLRDEELMTAEVSDFRATGGQAMVEMSAPGLRFDVAALRRVSERTGVHIVATTGLYSEDSWPQRFTSMGIEELAAFMRSEIEGGIDGTGIKAGHIKVAITDSSAPGVVIAHAEMFFASQDIAALVKDPLASRVNVDFAKELLDAGFNVSIDSFGHFYDAESLGRTCIADWQRLAGLIQLLEAGYSSQIVLGTDIFLKILTRRRGGEGYARLTGFVIPFLHRLGVAPAHITAMSVDNPARILSR
jgi:phosphotriesterase-related protein